MPDLRSIVDGLLAQPVAATPPLEHVVARARALRQRRRRQLTAATLAAFALLASVAVAFEREIGRENLRLVGDEETTTTTLPVVVDGSVGDDLPPVPGVPNAPPRSSTSTTTRPASGSAPGAGGAPAGRCAAAGANTGWDTGVDGDSIELVTERAQSLTGSTSSFLTGHVGVKAVVDRVNRAGGICGRMLHLRYADKPSPTTSAFAVVGPALGAKVAELDAAGVPIVGGTGLVEAQYASGWAWPVGPSMAGVARSIAEHAWEAGARTFGLVYENDGAGVEGAKAFRTHARALGATLKADVGLTPGRPGYGSEAQIFNNNCGADPCDAVAMLLRPHTANTYINSQQEVGGRKRGFGRLVTSAAPTMLHERVARDCGKHCDGLLVWTGFLPPIGEHAGDEDVARYVDDVKSVDPGIDINNPYLQSSWLGTELFVQALRDVGGNLNRARLQKALDDLVFRSGLVTDLRWGPLVPSQRVANTAVRAFRVVTASGAFVGFQDAGTGWQRDPHPGSFPS